MTPNWKAVNKIVGMIEILLGISVIILWIYSWHTVAMNLEQFGLKWERISFIKLVKQAHFVFLSGLLGLISGVLLFKGKRWGWITSIASLLIYQIGMILIIWDRINEGKEPLEDLYGTI